MPQIRLDVIGADDDISGINCGVPSIQEMMRCAYYMTISKQALSYNIVIDGTVIGNCLIKFGIFKDEDYNSEDPEYCAIDIPYLAIDKKYQSHRYGSIALSMLIQSAIEWSSSLPIRCLTLNALSGLPRWYRKLGFVEYPRDEDPKFLNCTPMMIDFMDKNSVDAYADSL